MLIRFLGKILLTLLVIAECLVSLRFIFLLISANGKNAIVSFVYDISDFLVKPFHGIIDSPWSVGRFTIDIDSLIAVAILMAAGFVVVEILNIFKPDRVRD